MRKSVSEKQIPYQEVTDTLDRKRCQTVFSDNAEELQTGFTSFGDAQEKEIKRRHSFNVHGENAALVSTNRIRLRSTYSRGNAALVSRLENFQHQRKSAKKRRSTSQLSQRKNATGIRKSFSPTKYSVSDKGENTGSEKLDINNKSFLAWARTGKSDNSQEEKKLLSVQDLSQTDSDDEVFEEQCVQKCRVAQKRVCSNLVRFLNCYFTNTIE